MGNEITRVELVRREPTRYEAIIDPGLISAEASNLSRDLPGANIEKALAVNGISTVQVARTAIGDGEWLYKAATEDARKVFFGVRRIRLGEAEPVNIPELESEEVSQ